MSETTLEHTVSLWMVDETPVRMFYAGQRWRVSDTPTRLRQPVWTAPLDGPRALYGWRFQDTAEDGNAVVFDVFALEDGWHVHRAYQ